MGYNLYVSADTRKTSMEIKLAALRANNIKTIVNMTIKCTDDDLKDLYGNHYVEFRINDSFKSIPEATIGLLWEWADKLQAARQTAGVLIHCYGGRNRSCLLAGMVLVRGGMTGAEATAVILSQQPKALYNPAFREFLETI
jgi:predicted protein tyrosine phosphatase